MGGARGHFRRKYQRGISLIEISIVVLLMGGLALLAGPFLAQVQKLVETTTTRLTEAQSADIGLRDVGKFFSATSVMKTGLLVCPTPGISEKRAAQDQIVLGSAGEKFHFAYATHSSLVGISTTSNQQVRTMDAAAFPKGAIVLISHIHDPAFGGLFRIKDVVKTTGVVTLEKLSAETPDIIGCSAAPGTTSSLYDLVNDDRHRIFNEKPTAFRADVIRFAALEVAKSATNPNKMDLVLHQWPVGLMEAADSRIVMPSVRKMVIDIGWSEDAPGQGTVSIDYAVTREEVRSVGNIKESALSGKVSYLIGGSFRKNFGAPTTPASANAIFPTCALAATPLQGVFRREGSTSTLVRVVKVEGVASNLGGRYGIIQASGRGTTPPSCWTSARSESFSFTEVPGSPGVAAGMPELVGIGSGLGFTLVPGLQAAYCEMKASSTIDAQLVYYDDAQGKSVKVPCAGVALAPETETYRYNGAATSCARDTGVITFGRLVHTTSTGVQGPPLYVDTASCQWEVNGAPLPFGNCRNFDASGELLEIRKLRSVRIRPSNIQISGATRDITCDCAHQVACN